jgi:hypothetical protein
VLNPSGAVAEALSTAVLVGGVAAAMELYGQVGGFEAVLATADAVLATPRLVGLFRPQAPSAP